MEFLDLKGNVVKYEPFNDNNVRSELILAKPGAGMSLVSDEAFEKMTQGTSDFTEREDSGDLTL